jgi:hypothetical protein
MWKLRHVLLEYTFKVVDYVDKRKFAKMGASNATLS